MNVSAFVDCNAESVVMRVPYELAAEMLANCPPSEDLKELSRWIIRAAARSKKFRESLQRSGIIAQDRDNLIPAADASAMTAATSTGNG